MLQGLIQSIRCVYVISALALPIRPDGAGNEVEEEDAGATALNYAHLKYVCKVSISTLCKKFIVRFPIANSIKCFEFSSLLFFFYFLPLQRDVNSCAGRLRVLFVPLLVTLFLFLYSLAVYLFLFYFSFNSLLPFHFAYIKRSLPARALVLSPSLSLSLAASLSLTVPSLLLPLLHFNVVVVVLFLTHTIC